MRTAAICPTCATYENAICVLYDGPYLPCTGISPLDSIAEALAKIDAAICALGGTTTTSTTTTAGPTTSTTTSSTSSTTTSSTSSSTTSSTSSTTTTTTTTATPTTTTTTTNCTTGLERHDFMSQIYDSLGNLINIQAIPIIDACTYLPAIQTGGSSSFYPAYVDSLTVGQTAIRSFCTPIPTGTYALADGSTRLINTFIAVVDGVITEILNCGTFVTFNVNLGTDQATACDPELSIPTYLFAASSVEIAGNTVYLDSDLTELAIDLEFCYGSNYYTTNGSGVVTFVGSC